MSELLPLTDPPAADAIFPGGVPQRLWFFFCAVALPSASFALSFTGIAAPEWQSGKVNAWAMLLLDRPGAAAFAPLAAVGMALAAAAAVRPGPWLRSAWARAGLLLALVLALQYSLLLPAAFFLHSSWAELPIAFWQWIPMLLYFGAMLAIPRAAGLVFRWGSRLAPQLPARLPGLAPALATLGVHATLFSLLLLFSLFSMQEFFAEVPDHLVWFVLGPMMLLALVAAPVWTADAIGHLLFRLGRPERWPAVGLGAALAVYLVSWRLAIARAVESYQALPAEYSGCFVATAAARAPSWLAGSFAGPGGCRVSPQLQRFKLFELALQALLPGCHRRLRRVYDRVGPALAAQISTPGRAALAWLALLPAELLAAALLRVLAGREISRRAATFYRR